MHHKKKWHFAKLCREKKKKPLYRVPAFNNHQIKSEFHTSTRRENIRKAQPLNGKRATHVPDICLWAVGCAGLFLGAGRRAHKHRQGEIPGKQLAVLEGCRAPRLPGGGWPGVFAPGENTAGPCG